MHAFTLKLLSHALNAIATLLNPPKMASHVGQPSHQPHGVATIPQQRQPTDMSDLTYEWSIVVDDAITGEPRGLILSSQPLSEQQAISQARSLLTSFRLLGTFIKPANSQYPHTTGLYLFSYILNRTTKLGVIWAHSAEDATNTLDHMAACGNLLCYCEPE